MGQFNILRIEIDGHFHGGEPIKPWVAEIKGLCPKFGLERAFVQPMNDWAEARKAWSGKIYGRVATFVLRDGNIYEVQRCRGNASKRHVVREFVAVEAGKRTVIKPEEALARVDGGGSALLYRTDDDKSGGSWISKVNGVGTPERLGFATVGPERLYRLRDGLHEVSEAGVRRLIQVSGQSVCRYFSQREALVWLLENAS